RGRPARGSGGGGPCRSSPQASASALRSHDLLGQRHPVAALALLQVDAVDDGAENPAQPDGVALALELPPHRAARERADTRLDRIGPHRDGNGHVALADAVVEQLVERDLQVLEVLERQVETDVEASQAEVSD